MIQKERMAPTSREHHSQPILILSAQLPRGGPLGITGSQRDRRLFFRSLRSECFILHRPIDSPLDRISDGSSGETVTLEKAGKGVGERTQAAVWAIRHSFPSRPVDRVVVGRPTSGGLPTDRRVTDSLWQMPDH